MPRKKRYLGMTALDVAGEKMKPAAA